MAKTNEGTVCDSFCNGCIFKGSCNGGMPMCEYFLITDKRRPCPAGTGCTVKQTGRKRQKWRNEDHSRFKNSGRKRRNAKVLQKVCPNCGQAFETTAAQQIYCCVKCKDAAYKNAQGPREVLQKVCANCGAAFQTTLTRKIYCCTNCKSAAANREKYWRYKARKEQNGKKEDGDHGTQRHPSGPEAADAAAG